MAKWGSKKWRGYTLPAAFVSGLLFGLVLGFTWLATTGGHAQERLRVLLLSPVQGPFAQRVRGQTGDLSLDLEAHEPMEGGDEAALDALIAANGADAALWLEGKPGSAPQVRLRDARKTVTQSRRAESFEGRPADGSALYEIAALLARAELVELIESRRGLAGDPTNVQRSEPATPTRVEPATAHEPELGNRRVRSDPSQVAVGRDDNTTSEHERRASQHAPTGLSYGFELGFRTARVNDARWLLGLEAGLFMARRALGLALYYAGTFRDPRTVQDVRVNLREDRLALHVGGVAHLTPSLLFQGGLDIGMGAFQRSARVLEGSFEPTPDQRAVSFLAGPRVNLRWSPTWYAMLGVSLGVDLLTMPVAYEIEGSSGRRQLERLAWAQPWFTVWLLGLSR